MFAGALFIKYAMGFSGDTGLYISILILLAIAGFFCISGGLAGFEFDAIFIQILTRKSPLHVVHSNMPTHSIAWFDSRVSRDVINH